MTSSPYLHYGLPQTDFVVMRTSSVWRFYFITDDSYSEFSNYAHCEGFLISCGGLRLKLEPTVLESIMVSCAGMRGFEAMGVLVGGFSARSTCKIPRVNEETVNH